MTTFANESSVTVLHCFKMGCSKSKRFEESKIHVALSDFNSRTIEDLRFEKGEQFIILDKKNGGDWWYAQSLKTNRRGFIPSNFVALMQSKESELWYFGKLRRSACETKLKHPANQDGAFMVRDSESFEGNYVLSVLIQKNRVNHYRVRRTKNGHYFIGETKKCSTLQELIKFHMPAGRGIPEQLGKPCIQIEPLVVRGFTSTDKWEIDRKLLAFGKKLGSGQFGDVYAGVYNKKMQVAIKTLKPGSMDPAEFLKEATIMKKLQHPKLVQLFAVCTLKMPIYIVTELMKHGSLLDMLKKSEKVTLPTMIDIAEQIADGMAYLESNQFIHRDLAARNVLVDTDRIVKIADFGLARMVSNEYNAQAGAKFPIKWTAPEAITRNKFSVKSDVWSFGILLYELVTLGGLPYPTMTNIEVLEILESGYRMPRPKNCDENYYEIMLSCWHKSPSKRPTFETLHWNFQDFFSLGSGEYLD